MKRSHPDTRGTGGEGDRHRDSEYDLRRRPNDSGLSYAAASPYSNSRRYEDEHSHHHHQRHRSRSRSPSPSRESRGGRTEGPSKDELEAARRARMARLRAENDEEEQRLVDLEKPSSSQAVNTTQRSGMVDASELEGLDEEEQMRRLLGFEGFGSTKNTKVEDNHKSSARGAAAKNKARKYRQYMNRKNGFNRPLDKID